MNFKFPDKVYDVLKWVVMIFLPALSALYYGLGKIWGWPYLTEIPGTISIITVFLGALIGISTVNYNKEKKDE